jgi:hypothetical protein
MYHKLLDNQKFIDCIESIAQSECDSRILLLDNYTKSFQFLGEWHEHNNLKYSNDHIIPSKNHYYSYDNNFYFDQTTSYRTPPKIKVQSVPPYKSEYWTNDNDVSAKDLEDLNGLIQTADLDELKKISKENPELVSHYLMAQYSGYDLSDISDCELYFAETDSSIQVNDLKPITNKRGH